MYKLLLIKISLLLSLTTILYATEKESNAKIAFLTDGISDIKYKDTRIAFTMWFNDFAKLDNLHVSIEFVNNKNDLIKDFLEGKYELIGLNSFYYYENHTKIDPLIKEFWSIQRGEYLHEKNLILAHKDSRIKKLSDLHSKKLVIRKGNYMGRLFLDKELLENLQTDSYKHLKSIYTTNKHSTAILNTFFKKADACVVPEYSFNLLKEMNPALGKDLVVIKESERIFVPVLTVTHTKTKDNMLHIYAKHASSLNSTSRGQNILNLFKMQGIYKIEKEELEPLKKYYQKYLILKKKYGD